jgi:hypothetical protein
MLETARRVSHCAAQRHKIALLAAVTAAAATPASNHNHSHSQKSGISSCVKGSRTKKPKVIALFPDFKLSI